VGAEVLEQLPDDIAAYLNALEGAAGTAATAAAPVTPRIDHGKALRLMRVLQRRRAAQAAEVAAYDEEIRRLSEARSRLIARYDRACEGLEALLAAYLRDVMALDPKRKSIDLAPYGRVQSRTAKAQPRLVDEDLLLRWAMDALPEAVDITPRLRWATAKAHLTVTPDGKVVDEDGQVVPGVECGAEDTKIDVRPSKEGEAL